MTESNARAAQDLPARTHIEAALCEAIAASQTLLQDGHALMQIQQAARILVHVFQHDSRVYTCGDGGSISDAMHFAEQLAGRYRQDHAGLPALAITDIGHLTCVASAYGYDQVLSRFVLTNGRPSDCLVVISTSGQSRNIINAAAAAKQMGVTVIALTGQRNTPLEALADVCVPTAAGGSVDRVHELHIKVIHILSELVERHFFPEKYASVPSGLR